MSHQIGSTVHDIKINLFFYRRIRRSAFRAWKRFPVVIRDAEKMKRRFEDMRNAVTALVPDFSASSSPNYLLDSVDYS